MVTGEKWRLGRRPALDGLRGIAVLLVMGYHAAAAYLPSGGSIGVTIFFVLSGFLIASLLEQEHATSGGISLHGFYGRRLRRLGPGLLAFLAGMVALTVVTGAPFVTPSWVASTLAFGNNWRGVAGQNSLGLMQTWSLAVEEQFYLMLPAVLVVTLRRGRRSALVVLGALMVASFAVRLSLWAGGADSGRWYYGTDAVVGFMLVGACFALVSRIWAPAPDRQRLGVVLLALVAAASTLPNSDGFSAAGMVAVAVVVGLALRWVTAGDAVSWLCSAPLRYAGRRSYALYLWHFPLACVILPQHFGTLGTLAGTFVLSFALAEGSWRLIESRFLAPRRRLREPVVHGGALARA